MSLIFIDLPQFQWLIRSNFNLHTVLESDTWHPSTKHKIVVIQPARYFANINNRERSFIAYAPTPEQALATSYRSAMEEQG